MKRSIPQFTIGFEWDREDDYVAYGICKINKDINLNLLSKGLGVTIPFLSSNKKIKLSFRVVDNFGNESIIYNTRDGGEYYQLRTIKGEDMRTTDLPVLSIDALYRVVLEKNVAYLCDFTEYDFGLCESIELNSNIGTSGLGNMIKEQFNMDKMYVEQAHINQEKGEIKVVAREE